MRVLYLVASGDIVGGIETNLLTVLDHASKYDLDVAGVLLPSEGKLADMIRQRHVPVGLVEYYGWRLTSPWRYVQTYCQLIVWIHRMKPDIIHCTHQWLVEYAWGLKKLLAKKPIICDLANLEDKTFIQERERFFACLDCTIVRSQAIADNLIEHATRPITTVLISNGIEVEKFSKVHEKPKIRQELNLASEVRLVGFVGRLVYWKGVEDLLAAWPHVLSEYPSAHLIIVGEDEEDNRYRHFLEMQTVELEIASVISFLGFRKNVAEVLAELELFVLPSHNEPFGIVTVEAMAAGCVVVATDGGGTPEIVTHGETGFLVPVAEPLALAKAILMALALPVEQANAIRNAAQRTAQELFGIEQQIRNQMSLYEAVVK